MSNIFRPSNYLKEKEKEKEDNYSNESNLEKTDVFSKITFRNNSLGSINDIPFLVKGKNKKNKIKKKKKNINEEINFLDEKKTSGVKQTCENNEIIKDEIIKPINLEDINNILNSDKSGEELLEMVNMNNLDINCTILVEKILNTEKVLYEWCDKNNFGLLLESLLKDKIEDQLQVLFIVVDYCNKLKLPKIEHNDKEKYLIDLLFYKLLINEIVDELAFDKWFEWEYDNLEKENIKRKCLFQLGDFLIVFKTIKYEEEEEEEKKDEDIKDEDIKDEDVKDEDVKDEIKVEKKSKIDQIMDMNIEEDIDIDDI